MADYERTHDLPTGCNTVVYAFRDTNGNRVLEMGSVSVPVGSSRLKFHRPQKITIQRAIPPPPPALVQVTPEIMTAVTLPSKKKIPKKKKKKTTKREDQPSNDRASLEPCPASYENTEYHHTEREERHEIESRTNISSKSYGGNHGRARKPLSTSSILSGLTPNSPSLSGRRFPGPQTPLSSSAIVPIRNLEVIVPWCDRCRARGPFSTLQRQCCSLLYCTACGPHSNGKRGWTNCSHRRQEAEDNARRAGSALQNHGIQESGDEAQDMEVEVEVQASNTSDQVNRRRYRGPRGRA